MRLTSIVVAAFLVACTVEPPTGESATPSAVLRDARFDPIADILLDELAANGLGTAVSIAVHQGGVPLWVEGFGTADPKGDVPVTPDTVFVVGNLPMTAAAVLQQVDAGLYTRDDILGDLLPDLVLDHAAGLEAATVHELLTHQGGASFWYAKALKLSSDDERLASWHYDDAPSALYSMVSAGELYNWNTPNYSYAGLVVEEHDPSGRWYADILVEDLFEPLGMNDTFARKRDVLEAGVPYSLSVGVSGDSFSEFGVVSMKAVADPAPLRPSGGVWSTPSDLCRWGEFLLHGNDAVLSGELGEQITMRQVSTHVEQNHYGYGYGAPVWDLWETVSPPSGFYPVPFWFDDWLSLSFTSYLLALPEQDVVIAVTTNAGGYNFWQTMDALAYEFVDPWPAAMDYVATVHPDGLAQHAGSYESVRLGRIDIAEGGTYGLTISIPALNPRHVLKSDLVPYNTDLWSVVIDNLFYSLTFVRDSRAGPTPYLANPRFVGARVDAAALAGLPRPDPAGIESLLREAALFPERPLVRR